MVIDFYISLMLMKQKGFTFLVNPFFDYKLKLSKNRPIKLC